MSTPVGPDAHQPAQRWKNNRQWMLPYLAVLGVGTLVGLVLLPLHLTSVVELPVWLAVILGVVMGLTLSTVVPVAIVMLLAWVFGPGRKPSRPATALPDEMWEVTGPEAAVDWGEDGPPVNLHLGVKHRVDGTTVAGRDYMVLATHMRVATLWWVMVRLDGWLPNLTAYNREVVRPGMFNDDAHFEDYEFNHRYQIISYDRSLEAQRYAHAFFTPQMMEYLLSEEPIPFLVRGEWILTDIKLLKDPSKKHGFRALRSVDDAITAHWAVVDHLDEIADFIPAHLYSVYVDDTDLRARCRAANPVRGATAKPV